MRDVHGRLVSLISGNWFLASHCRTANNNHIQNIYPTHTNTHDIMCMYVLDRLDDPLPTRSEAPLSSSACLTTTPHAAYVTKTSKLKGGNTQSPHNKYVGFPITCPTPSKQECVAYTT